MTTAQAATQAGYKTTMVGTVVRVSFLVTLSAGLLAVLLAALVSGSSAALGAGIATAMVCVVFGFGAVVLNVISALSPSASLLVALLTYTLNVVLIGVVFVGLSGSGALDGDVDERWLGGTVIACTLVWLATQIFCSMRVRIPVYDLRPGTEEADAR